ncbi:hypothetical protein MFLAVUS_006426 [Mucor flavus]|uniref:Methyltransferase domain-containing protein n=1 Tax=Mucor flavus TaxID=439312 RepID=A0ABP9Z1H8_9FUNG
MGSYNSTSRRGEAESAYASKSSRIPKHLQPLKRKKTKKSSISSTSTSEPKASAEITPPPLFNPANTFQEENYGGEPLDSVVVDHSVSSPQLCLKNKKTGSLKTTYDGVESRYISLPCSQPELDRQRVVLYIMRWAFESRHLVPPIIKQKLFEGIRVLDVGCGPGLWLGHPLLDMAEDFRKSVFDSIDICNLVTSKQEAENNPYHFPSSKAKVTELSVKSKSEKLKDNFTFTEHNMIKDGPLPFADNSFDYTQQSQVLLVYNRENWKKKLLDLKRVTKPGGIIRLLEVDLYPQKLGEKGGLWRDQVHRLVDKAADIPTRISCHLEQVLADAGLENIESRFVTIPVGSWGLDIGVLWEYNLIGFLDSFKPFLSELMEVTEEEYEEQQKALTDELQDENIKPFNNIFIAWGKVKETE